MIRKDGTVGSRKVLKGLGYGLDESAINTMMTKWLFRPGTVNGEPYDVEASVVVSSAAPALNLFPQRSLTLPGNEHKFSVQKPQTPGDIIGGSD